MRDFDDEQFLSAGFIIEHQGNAIALPDGTKVLFRHCRRH